jgi:hypothetical protein
MLEHGPGEILVLRPAPDGSAAGDEPLAGPASA